MKTKIPPDILDGWTLVENVTRVWQLCRCCQRQEGGAAEELDPTKIQHFLRECYWFCCTSISGMCADLALCSCRKNLPGCGKSPLLADQGAGWPYRLSPAKRVIIAMSWWQRQRWQYKNENCNEDNGDDNETRGHLSLQHVLLLEIGLHVCRHPKMPIFYSGQVCDEKEQSKLDHLERTHIREKRWWGAWGGNISGCRKLNCRQQRGPSRFKKNKRNMVQLLTEQPSCLLNGPQSPTNIYNVLTNHFGQEMFSAGLYNFFFYKKK